MFFLSSDYSVEDDRQDAVTDDEDISSDFDDEQDDPGTDNEDDADGESNDPTVDSDADPSDSSSKDKKQNSAEEKAAQDHQKKVYDGMVKSWVTKIVMGDPNPNKPGKIFQIEDIADERMRMVVKEKLAAAAKGNTIDDSTMEERIAKRVMQETELSNVLNKIDVSMQEAAREEYRIATAAKQTHEASILKIKKLFSVLEEDEQDKLSMAYGQRTHKVGTSTRSIKKVRYNSRQAEIAKRSGNDPEKVYAGT